MTLTLRVGSLDVVVILKKDSQSNPNRHGAGYER